jgi:uncharacterized protein (TIGR02145 family)
MWRRPYDFINDSRDGKTYKTVAIGEQIWMAENLSYNATGSKCYGEGGYVVHMYCGSNSCSSPYYTLSDVEIQANCDKYGKLYDWATAKSIEVFTPMVGTFPAVMSGRNWRIL